MRGNLSRTFLDVKRLSDSGGLFHHRLCGLSIPFVVLNDTINDVSNADNSQQNRECRADKFTNQPHLSPQNTKTN
jgi:hypothetical protein